MNRSVLVFFVAAFAITWGLQAPIVLAHRGIIAGPPEQYLSLAGLGALGPTFAAILAARSEGPGNVRALLRGLLPSGARFQWYLIALFLPGLLYTLGMLVARPLGAQGELFYPPNAPERWIALFFFPIGEEIGWRGFAQPRLYDKLGGMRASIIIGIAWCFWHAAMFDFAGSPPWLLFASLLFFVPGAMLYTWIWKHGNRSLLIAVLAHMSVHLNNSNRPGPQNMQPFFVHTAALLVCAIVLYFADRSTFEAPSETRLA